VRDEILKRLKQAPADFTMEAGPHRYHAGNATILADYLQGLAEQLVPTSTISF
jgi:hypothetical protein